MAFEVAGTAAAANVALATSSKAQTKSLGIVCTGRVIVDSKDGTISPPE